MTSHTYSTSDKSNCRMRSNSTLFLPLLSCVSSRQEIRHTLYKLSNKKIYFQFLYNLKIHYTVQYVKMYCTIRQKYF